MPPDVGDDDEAEREGEYLSVAHALTYRGGVGRRLTTAPAPDAHQPAPHGAGGRSADLRWGANPPRELARHDSLALRCIVRLLHVG